MLKPVMKETVYGERMTDMRKQITGFFLTTTLIMAVGSTAMAAKSKKEEPPAFKQPQQEHHYQLQEDSYEATDTEGGYRHYICADCGDEYDYHTDPLVYETNPKTGEPVDQAGAFNPLLPTWEHIPDPEPQVYWSKEDNEWRCYIYGSHDELETGSCGFNYILYSAPVYDLSDWRYEGMYLDISEGATSGATVGLFAPDCAYDLQTDQYYMISNEFNAYSVLRVSDSPTGPWPEDEAVWYYTVKGCYDPSIYIENGTIYIAGSCMKQVYNEYPEIAAMVAEDDYHTGMSHIGVLYQLKEDLTDGDGIEAVSWLPNDERNYLPIYEGPSLQGWVEELGVYVYIAVLADVGPDDILLNCALGWYWTDDLMNGTWHIGENGIDEVYKEQAEVISGNKGNIISDTSGRYTIDPKTGEMVFSDFTTYPFGNNHGGMAKINGKWYYFGHRQTNNHSFTRQAVAGEVQLYKDGDTPVITPFEYTSSGIAGSMDAWTTYDADRTCYLIQGTDIKAPSMERNTTHYDTDEIAPYIVGSRDEEATHARYIIGLRNNNIVGYKYLDFGEEEASATVRLLVTPGETAPGGSVDVYIDAPSEDQGGTKIGTAEIPADLKDTAAESDTATDGTVWYWTEAAMDVPVSGIHGVYFVFHSDSEDVLCSFDQFAFIK